MTSSILKGSNREASLDREIYFSEDYFSMKQLCSLSHQINHVMRLKPHKVLEIGPGNGFLSVILRQSGVDVTTVDINPNLKPDIISSINDLQVNLKEKDFSLVVCTEVLEHMPFSEFKRSIEIFREYSSNLYLTLPQYRTWFGFSGWIRFPRVSKLFNIGFYINTGKKLDEHAHFWEIDQNYNVSKTEIIKVLSSKYNYIESGSFCLNKYHEYFVCSTYDNIEF